MKKLIATILAVLILFVFGISFSTNTKFTNLSDPNEKVTEEQRQNTDGSGNVPYPPPDEG